MGCWVISSVTLTMKGLLSVLLYRLPVFALNSTRRVLTVPLHTSQNFFFFIKTARMNWKIISAAPQQQQQKQNCLLNSDVNAIYLQIMKTQVAAGKCRETDMWVIWKKTSQEFDIHLSQYHSLYPLSTLSFTDKALMSSLPSTCIWIACQRRKK